MNINQATLSTNNTFSADKAHVPLVIIGAVIASLGGTYLLMGMPGVLIGSACYFVESAVGIKTPEMTDGAWGVFILISMIWPLVIAAAYVVIYRLLARKIQRNSRLPAFLIASVALTFVVCDPSVLNSVTDGFAQISTARLTQNVAHNATFVRREGHSSVFVDKKGDEIYLDDSLFQTP